MPPVLSVLVDPSPARVRTGNWRAPRPAAADAAAGARGKGLLAADDSAGRVAAHIERLDASTSGTFWAADTGEVLSW